MITKEVRDWLIKVERMQYSFDDAISEFMYFSKYLTREEMRFIKAKIEQAYSDK